jgi:mycoredoxin
MPGRATGPGALPTLTDLYGGWMLTVYSTTWCGYCVRLKKLLDREGIQYAEVNIEDDEAAAQLVEVVNGGNRTVPTVVLPDGSALTNPSIDQVKQALAA